MRKDYSIFDIDEKDISKRLGLVERMCERFKYDEDYSYIRPQNIDYIYAKPNHIMALHPKTETVRHLIEQNTDFKREKKNLTSEFIQILTRYGVKSKEFKDKYGKEKINQSTMENLWCEDAIDELHMDFAKCVKKEFMLDLLMFGAIFGVNFNVYSSKKMPLVFESDVLNVVVSPIYKRKVNEINMY